MATAQYNFLMSAKVENDSSMPPQGRTAGFQPASLQISQLNTGHSSQARLEAGARAGSKLFHEGQSQMLSLQKRPPGRSWMERLRGCFERDRCCIAEDFSCLAALDFRECMQAYMPGNPTRPGAEKTRETAASTFETASKAASNTGSRRMAQSLASDCPRLKGLS